MKKAIFVMLLATVINEIRWIWPLLIVGKEQFGTYQYAIEEMRVHTSGILWGWGSLGAVIVYLLIKKKIKIE